ncbi:hypothetical protein [Brevibacillus sp. SYSU BS000544]|uniref:hypothetical protein n=1 Tax=Brevibacillus sp. SYSU BS000544 TaxID=3416443 RepID=UPI003CE47E53
MRWIVTLLVLMLFVAACGAGNEVTIPTYKVIKSKKTPASYIVMVQTSVGISEEQVKLVSKEVIEKQEKKAKKYTIEFYEREADIAAGPTIAAAQAEVKEGAAVDPQTITVKMVPDDERKAIQEMVDQKRVTK